MASADEVRQGPNRGFMCYEARSVGAKVKKKEKSNGPSLQTAGRHRFQLVGRSAMKVADLELGLALKEARDLVRCSRKRTLRCLHSDNRKRTNLVCTRRLHVQASRKVTVPHIFIILYSAGDGRTSLRCRGLEGRRRRRMDRAPPPVPPSSVFPTTPHSHMRSLFSMSKFVRSLTSPVLWAPNGA